MSLNIRRYLVTLRHDSGIYRVIIASSSAERAAELICEMEQAPPQAVLSVSEVKA